MTSQVNSLTTDWQKMKCLSLKQPFAQLVVEGRKTIELRKWNTKFRGTFLVHASKVGMYDFYSDFGYSDIPQGAIIGTARLYDVKHYETEKEWHGDSTKHLAGDEFADSVYGFMLENPFKFEKPISIAGQLNFFDLYFNRALHQVKREVQAKLSENI